MDWAHFTPWSALLGGVLIGLATGLTLLLNGKIAGISGVLGRILRPQEDDSFWRLSFLVGLALGGALTVSLVPGAGAMVFPKTGGLLGILVAGVLVGFGTRYGGGCTSGHGVCGISRASKGGAAATVTFMVVAGLVVFATRVLVSGGAS